MSTISVDDYELERLRAELEQEKQMKQMLDESTSELRLTVNELDKRFDGVIEEGNEWKTRFETQEEMNQVLSKQILLLQDKVEEARRSLKDGKVGKHMKGDYQDDFNEANPHLVKILEKDKASLESQLRDLEWRLDQESKAYHKANDERKQYVMEINLAKYTIDDIKTRHKDLPTINSPRGSVPNDMKTRHKDLPASNSPRGNIPNDQRILDPRKGPIKKAAAVKSLPRLDSPPP